jgi:cardiolipin-specific phospholipase
LGGYLSGRFVEKFPELVEAVVLISPVGVDDVPQPEDVVSIPSPFQSLEKFRWWAIHSMLRTAWSANLTPQALVRFVNPEKGREWIRNGLRRRFNERWNDEDLEVISNYLYKITAAPALGEYAMNSLLYPPMRVKANSISSGIPSSVSSSRSRSSSMEDGETNRIFARESLSKLLTQSLSEFYKTTNRKIPILLIFGDSDWLAYRNAESDMKKWREKFDMDASYRLISNAGHHIYMDNVNEFHQSLIEWLNERGVRT